MGKDSRECTLRELQEVEKQLRELGARRNVLQTALNSATDHITTKCPIEIIAYIFQLSVDQESEGTWPHDLGPNTSNKIIPPAAPLRLGAVCKRWRTIAWSLPRLWTTLAVNLASENYALGPELVAQWLGRTENQPLHIKVFFEQIDDDEEEPSICTHCVLEHGKSVMEIINRHASQWRLLDLTTIPACLDLLQVLRWTNGTRSSLKYLLLGDENGPLEMPTMKGIFSRHGLQHSPTHLTILSSIPSYQLHINWAHIRHLEIRHSTETQCLNTIMSLSQSPLESVKLVDIHHPTNAFWSVYPPVEFPHLRSLSVTVNADHGDPTAVILNNIRLPSLTNLEIIYGLENPPPDGLPVQAILNLLRRSECVLQTLTLGDAPTDDEDLIPFLRDIPTLTTFNIDCFYMNDPEVLFNALSCDEKSDSNVAQFLPNLQTLVITGGAPERWASLISIYDEEATVIVDENTPTRKCSKRNNLRIALSSWTPPETDECDDPALPDRCSFLKLISLWCDHGINCLVQYSRLHRIYSSREDIPYAHRLMQECYDRNFGGGNGDPDRRILNRMKMMPVFK